MFQFTAARRRLHAASIDRIPASGGFNSQPPEGGCLIFGFGLLRCPRFQFTAARRRLPTTACGGYTGFPSFNSQPPEGGCTGCG